MRRQLIGFGVVVVLLSFAAFALAGSDIKIRFLGGSRVGAAEAPAAVTSSYQKLDYWGTVPSSYSLEEEIAKIKKIFNLNDVMLITEANLAWPSGEDKIFHIIRFQDKEYLLLISPRGQGKASKFRIEVFEQKDGGKTNLLDTESIFPPEEAVIFGFEDRASRPYFLYVSWPAGGVLGGVEGGVLGGVEGGVKGGVLGGVQGGVEGGVVGGVVGGVAGGEDAVRATKDVKPPKLIKMVEPAYPEEARKAGVEGTVILEATADKAGKVINVKVLRSIPLLDQAAIDALKQWVYEPMMINGKPTGVIFTVTTRFTLDDGKKPKGEVQYIKEVDEEFAKGAVKCEGTIKPPKLIKQVEPIYPEVARQGRIEGFVILAVRTDAQGQVKATKLLRSIPKLDQAAIDAVKQWVYEPLVVEGKPKEAVFTVTVRFKLK